jgi:hypothetical protein
MLLKTATAALAVGLGLAGLATPATAGTVLIFAQNGAIPPTNFVITNNGDGTSSISADISVSITALAGPLVPPPITDAVFEFSATSTSQASTFVAGGITFLVQRYSGTFSIDSATDPATVYLAGSFVDLTSGPVGGRALTIAASEPPDSSVTFTSTVLPADDLQTDRAIALSATNLSIPVTFASSPVGTTLGSTTSNIAGTFSADTATSTPEPSTWAMLLLGFAGLGFAGRRSRKAERAMIGV